MAHVAESNFGTLVFEPDVFQKQM